MRSLGIQRQRYVTPLILAACLQNFKIVELFLENGFTICDPQTDAQQSVNSNAALNEKLGPAVFRLNRYRALASPVYIAASFLQNSLSGPDPVHRACVLNKEWCDMAKQEYEFRKEYLELSNGYKEFALALLNECRSIKEIRCVMELRNEKHILPPKMEGKFLNILEFVIVTRNEKVSQFQNHLIFFCSFQAHGTRLRKNQYVIILLYTVNLQFVSHPYSQLVLNSEIYRRVPFLEKSSWKQFATLMVSALFPFIFMVWIVFENVLPNHKVARMFHSSCMKFLIHCGSYQTFLLMLVLTSLRQSQSSFLEYVLTGEYGRRMHTFAIYHAI